jgi:hypothetical protein
MNQPSETIQYGASTWICDYLVEHQLAKLRPATIVDFGAGAGKNGLLAKKALGTASKLIAVEGFARTAEMLQQMGPYDRVDQALIQDWLATNKDRYSVALFGDVIEHLTPREIHSTIRSCLQRFDHIIIVVPLHDIFQDDAYGNPLEEHKTYVTSGFFDRYRPIEKHIVESPEFTMMNVVISARPVISSVYQRITRNVFHVAMLLTQPLGLARPLVKVLKCTVGGFKSLTR